jgi:hypothetical protein
MKIVYECNQKAEQTQNRQLQIRKKLPFHQLNATVHSTKNDNANEGDDSVLFELIHYPK